MTNTLKHIAFIMDGNGRWATARNLPRTTGHRKGAEVLQQIAEAVADMDIKFMTVYAFSTENWKRDAKEVNYLMDMLREYLHSGFKEIKERGARIRFIGEREMLAPDICEAMAKLETETAQNDKLVFCVALSYGSRAEIVHAAREIASQAILGKLKIDEITESTFTGFLYTDGLPDPDLVIRTSGEQRISNYLLWQSAYSEFYFTKTLWPDFTATELKTIVDDYNSRERRYGKV